jgi:hypothetical protein
MTSVCVTGASGKRAPACAICLQRVCGVWDGIVLAIDQARDLLGFVPRHSWCDTIGVDGSDNHDANGGDA